MPSRIDAHHHFWKYTPEEFGWLDGGMARLRRDFGPGDLEPCLAEAGIDGVVSVQARQCLDETEFLLSLASRHSFIQGVVGWVPLDSKTVGDDIERLAAYPKLRSVRHVVQNEPDERFILRKDFNRGVALLQPYGLAYDLLIFERHLPHAIEFVDRHPGQIFVLNHIAKPRVKERLIEPWARLIKELARRDNVYCKVSGMVTEADYHAWIAEQLQPYFDTVLDAFSPRRLMFGSDWPVCLAAASYLRWHQTVQAWAGRLSLDEQAALFGGTAQRAYQLKQEE